MSTVRAAIGGRGLRTARARRCGPRLCVKHRNLARSCALETLGNRDQMACTAQAESLGNIVDPIQPRPTRIARHGAVHVIDHGARRRVSPPGCLPLPCAPYGRESSRTFPGAPSRQSCRPRPGQGGFAWQIINGRVLRLQQFGEVFGLYTCEGDLESVLRQALGQKILNPFRPGIMFAIDKMQHPGSADSGYNSLLHTGHDRRQRQYRRLRQQIVSWQRGHCLSPTRHKRRG